MGTSKSYSAPTSPNWSALKSEVTRSTGSSIDGTKAAHIIQRFLRAAGGEAAIARGTATGNIGRSALNVASKTSGLLGGVASRGGGQGFQDIGIVDWSTKSAGEIKALLLNYLAPEAGTQDETDARAACAELLAEVLEGAVDAADVARRFEEFAAQGPVMLIARYAALYVYAKFRKTFEERLQSRKTPREISKMLDEVRTYLRLSAERLARKSGTNVSTDWSRVTRSYIATLFERAFKVFGGEQQ